MTRTLLLLLLGGACGAGLLLALLLTPLALRAARRIGFVDRPGGHKSHTEPIPYGGGTAMLLAAWVPIGAALALAFTLPTEWLVRILGVGIVPYVGGLREKLAPTLTILTGGLVLHVLGLLDDRRALRALPKLVVILLVAVLVAAVGDVRLAEFAGAPLSVLFTTLWIVVIVNAFNFLDNMDGLSAGVALLCTAALVPCGIMAQQVFVPVLGCVFVGAIAGFLVFNFPPARIFMGDAGSLLLGYMLAVVSILTTYYETRPGAPPFALAMPLVVLAIPLYDFASVITIRLREGRDPMKGDQRHFSHRLVERGLSRRFAVVTIYLATAATGLAATLLPGAGLRETVTVLVLVLLVLAIIAILESPLRRRA